MNLIRIPLYSQLLRNDCPFPNEMCSHKSWVSVVNVMLYTPFTKIYRSFIR